MSEIAEYLADLTSYRDRDVLDTILVGVLRDLLGPRGVAICRVLGEGADQRWLTRASWRQGDIVASADPTWVDIEDLPLLVTHPARYEALIDGRMVQLSSDTGHLSVLPLAADLEVVGVLEIETGTPLDSAAQHTVASILRLFGNLQSLLDYSERDSLTGLLNRKTFDGSFFKLSTVLASANTPGIDGRRKAGLGHRCWLGMIDIDHFKSVNDNFGHLIGDEVLLLLSRMMRSSFRFHDTLYRFGGEEFVVLMRCSSQCDAANAFDRLRLNTETYAFPQVGCVTVSVGITELKAGDSPNGALERADKAVYYAKGHGRNQVCDYENLVARGELAEEGDKVGDIELF